MVLLRGVLVVEDAPIACDRLYLASLHHYYSQRRTGPNLHGEPLVRAIRPGSSFTDRVAVESNELPFARRRACNG
jgi:hypothetical protein